MHVQGDARGIDRLAVFERTQFRQLRQRIQLEREDSNRVGRQQVDEASGLRQEVLALYCS